MFCLNHKLIKMPRSTAFYAPRDRSSNIPYTMNLPQPHWDENYGNQKVRKLSQVCRLGKSLESTAFKCWLKQFEQTKRFEHQYSLSVKWEPNKRTNFMLVGRHQAFANDDGSLYNLPMYGRFISDSSTVPHQVVAKPDGIESFWSNYNAQWYETQSVWMAQALPGTTSNNLMGLVNWLVGQDYYNVNAATNVGAVQTMAPTYAFDATLNPHVAPYSGLSQLVSTQRTNSNWVANGATIQRHQAGGMKINITNTSEWPMVCDIIVYKCKKNPKGDDIGSGPPILPVTDTGGTPAPPSMASSTVGNYIIGDQLSPPQNIWSCHDKRFQLWKEQGNLTNQTDQNDFKATNEFIDGVPPSTASSDGNVNSMPTWKLLGQYKGCDSGKRGVYTDTTTTNVVADWYIGQPNYKEIERVRVAVPLSSSYVHTIEYGGMDYDVSDRCNRAQNQGNFYTDSVTAIKNIMKINDIGGETICVAVSCVGAQVTGKVPTVPGGSETVKTMAVPKGECYVRVSEYEVIHPWYTLPSDSITQTAGHFMKLAETAEPEELIPMTQWVKNTN